MVIVHYQIRVHAKWDMRKMLQIRKAVDAYQNVKIIALTPFVQAQICVFVLRDTLKIGRSQQTTYVSGESDAPAPHSRNG
jgi:hypothetical protein